MKLLCLIEGENLAHRHFRGNGEVFTHTKLVLEILEEMPDEIWDEGKTFADAQCGNGQMLIPVAIIKKELGHKNILETIFGADLMDDNVQECRNRLLQVCGINKKNLKITENNVICKDALK